MRRVTLDVVQCPTTRLRPPQFPSHRFKLEADRMLLGTTSERKKQSMRCVAQGTLPERMPIQTNRGLLQGHTSCAQVLRSESQSANSDAAFSYVCAAHVLHLQRYLLPSCCVLNI